MLSASRHPRGFLVPVSHPLPLDRDTPPSPAGATGQLRGPSCLRGMSQVPRQGVKHAAEVNKSRAYAQPITTCFMSRLDDSITGYVGHMVPVVTVKLIPCESSRQPGKLLGGAQEVPANCTHRLFFTASGNDRPGLELHTHLSYKRKSVNGRKSSLQAEVIINATLHWLHNFPSMFT